MLKQFGQNFLASLSKPQTYLTALNQPGVFVTGYFILATALLSLVSASWFYFQFRPQFMTNLERLRDELSSNLPPDRHVTFDGTRLEVKAIDEQGVASSTDKPIMIKSPTVLPRLLGFSPTQALSWERNWFANLVIVTPTKIDKPSEYMSQLDTTTMVLFDPETMYLTDGQGEWRENKLSESQLSQGTLTAQIARDQLHTWHATAADWLAARAHYIWPIVIVATLVGQVFALIWNSLLVFLITKVFGFALTFGKSAKFTAYVTVVSLLISQVTFFIYPWLPIDMHNLSFWVLTTYLFWTLRNHLPKTSKPLVR